LKYIEFIKTELAPRYAEFIGHEIQKAYLESYHDYGQNLFDRYIDLAPDRLFQHVHQVDRIGRDLGGVVVEGRRQHLEGEADTTEVSADPVHLMYVLEQAIRREQLPPETEKRYIEFIKTELAPRYAEFIVWISWPMNSA
jgi:predicted Ser/Thr protein kinase